MKKNENQITVPKDRVELSRPIHPWVFGHIPFNGYARLPVPPLRLM